MSEQWLQVVSYDMDGNVKVMLRNKTYKRFTTWYILERFLNLVKYNQYNAKVYLWENSVEC